MNLIYVLASVMALLLMAGCSKGNQVEDIDPEYFPVKLAGEKSWGMMSKDGKILFESEFKNCPSAVYNGIFAVREGDGYSLYYADSKPRLVPECENLLAAGLFAADDYAPIVRKGKRIAVINRDGEEMYTLTPQKGKEIIYARNFFTDGMLVVQDEDGKCGAINHDGELTVACKFDGIYSFNGGYAMAMTQDKEKDQKKYQIIDHDGNIVHTIKSCKDVYSLIYDGKCVIQIDDDRWGFVTIDGDVVKCPAKVKGIGAFDGKYFTYYDDDDNVGLMEYNDDGGEVLIKASKYKSLIPINKSWSKFIARIDDEYRLIDRDDETLVKFEDYKYVRALSQSAETIVAKDGNYYTVLDDDGKVIDKKLEIEDINEGSIRMILSDYPKVREIVKEKYPYSSYDNNQDEYSEEKLVTASDDEPEEAETWATTDDYNYYPVDSARTEVAPAYNYYDKTEEVVAAEEEYDYYDYPNDNQ